MLKQTTATASPNARVVSFRMKSRIFTVTAAMNAPTKAAAIMPATVAGTKGHSKLVVRTAARYAAMPAMAAVASESWPDVAVT